MLSVKKKNALWIITYDELPNVKKNNDYTIVYYVIYPNSANLGRNHIKIIARGGTRFQNVI